MPEYTSKYTRKQIEEKLDSISNDNVWKSGEAGVNNATLTGSTAKNFGSNSITVGSSLNNYGNSSILSGFNSFSRANNSMISGQDHEIDTGGQLIIGGERNKIKTNAVYSELITGVDNEITAGDSSIVSGRSNICNASNNIVSGQLNNASNGGNSLVMGYCVTNSGSRSIIGGSYVKNTTEASLVVGRAYCTGDGYFSIVGGTGQTIASYTIPRVAGTGVTYTYSDSNTGSCSLRVGQGSNSGRNSIVGGDASTVGKIGGTTLNQNYTAYIANSGINSLRVGTGANAGNNAIVGGEGTYNTGQSSLVVGSDNVNTAWGNIVGGSGNTVIDGGGIVSGRYNTVSSNENIVCGYNNTVNPKSSQNIVSGNTNILSASGNYSQNNIISGRNNDVDFCNNSIICGNNNVIKGAGSNMVDGVIVCGNYANLRPIEGNLPRIIVGDGSASKVSNSFVVESNGQVDLSNLFGNSDMGNSCLNTFGGESFIDLQRMLYTFEYGSMSHPVLLWWGIIRRNNPGSNEWASDISNWSLTTYLNKTQKLTGDPISSAFTVKHYFPLGVTKINDENTGISLIPSNNRFKIMYVDAIPYSFGQNISIGNGPKIYDCIFNASSYGAYPIKCVSFYDDIGYTCISCIWRQFNNLFWTGLNLYEGSDHRFITHLDVKIYGYISL